MKRILLILLIIIFPVQTYAKNTTSTFVMDYNSGRVLYEENAHEQKLIASITKVMTCIIVLENCNINETVMIGEEVLTSYGTNIYIEVGELITIKDLLYGLMLRSGNDAAIALSVNTLGEKEFIEKMNRKAKELGMNNTIFENPHGLDDSNRNLSTAYDMALLARYSYKNEMFKKIINTKKYKTKTNLKSYIWNNRMQLLSNYKCCIGGKNGYTPKAGKTLISYAKKEDKLFIIVTLNDNDPYNHHKKLYEDLFSKYDYYTIIDKKKFIINSSLAKGKLYIKESFQYPLKKEELDEISTLVEIIKNNKDNTGNIKIYLNKNEIGKIKIYNEKEKKEDKTNIFQKIIHLFTR